MATTRARGTLGEDFAAVRLAETGYEILARNWRSGRSEIDLIARLGDIIAFIEVKTRAESSFSTPAQAVSRAQRRRIALAAVEFLRARGLYNTGEIQPRFDIFEVVTRRAGSPQVVRYEHLTGAYDTGDLHVFI